ncbi:MAG: hypothetical protein AAGE52_25090 [Myxococcota bacterium]
MRGVALLFAICGLACGDSAARCATDPDCAGLCLDGICVLPSGDCPSGWVTEEGTCLPLPRDAGGDDARPDSAIDMDAGVSTDAAMDASECTIEVCDDGIDNDCNGEADCDDPACSRTAACDCSDATYASEIEMWNAAGVTDAPRVYEVYSTITPLGPNAVRSSVNGETTIAAELAAADADDARAVVMADGVYEVRDFDFANLTDVELRAETRWGARIESSWRNSEDSIDRYAVVEFKRTATGCRLNGVEIEYVRPDCDETRFNAPSFDEPTTYNMEVEYTNAPCGRNDFNVTLVEFEVESRDNAIVNARLLNAGDRPLNIIGNHNTIENNWIEGTYKKGPGMGYLHVIGNQNLLKNNTIRNIRHLGITEWAGGRAQKAAWNVVVYNDIGTNVDFHNGDGGHNFVGHNVVRTPISQPWLVCTTGVPARSGWRGHAPPGVDNYIFDNRFRDSRAEFFDSVEREVAPYSDPAVVYRTNGNYSNNHPVTSTTGEVDYEEGVYATRLPVPACGSFWTAQPPPEDTGYLE